MTSVWPWPLISIFSPWIWDWQEKEKVFAVCVFSLWFSCKINTLLFCRNHVLRQMKKMFVKTQGVIFFIASVSDFYKSGNLLYKRVVLERNKQHLYMYIHENRYFLISCRLFKNSQGVGVISTFEAILSIYGKISFLECNNLFFRYWKIHLKIWISFYLYYFKQKWIIQSPTNFIWILHDVWRHLETSVYLLLRKMLIYSVTCIKVYWWYLA